MIHSAVLRPSLVRQAEASPQARSGIWKAYQRARPTAATGRAIVAAVVLAKALNDYKSIRRTKDTAYELKSWELLDKTLRTHFREGRISPEGLTQLNAMTRMAPVSLRFSVEAQHEVKASYHLDGTGVLLPWLLFWRVLTHGGSRRLRICPTCDRWFGDNTKARNKERCSAKCTHRHWDRSRRRQERHSQYRGKSPGRSPAER
jgi:predicted RNA-binding Zn ribbon-like protein